MAFFLAHIALLGAFSLLTSRRLFGEKIDTLLAAGLLAWTNVVATSLTLSSLGKLGDPVWYFRTSATLGIILWLVVKLVGPKQTIFAPIPKEISSRTFGWFALASLIPFAVAILIVCSHYDPNNYDSLTYHLPRVVFYIGQGSLTHFPTYNDRQIYFPFNHTLLYLGPLLYDAPTKALTFYNAFAWVTAGLAIFRVCRIAGRSFNGSALAVWIALLSTQVIAQACSTTNDLPTAACLATTAVFVLRWTQTGARRDALISGLGLGLVCGSKLTIVYFAPGVAAALVIFFVHAWLRGQLLASIQRFPDWLLPSILTIALILPVILLNLSAKGQWMTPAYDFTRNHPFNIACALQTSATYLFQFFLEPLHRFTFDLEWTSRLNNYFRDSWFDGWNPAHAFSPFYLFPPDLNEDHVWFGFAGPFAMCCGGAGLLYRKKWCTVPSLAAIIGFSWFIAFFLLNRWSLYNQRYFISAYFALVPSVAMVWDTSRNWTAWRRYLLAFGICIVLLCSSWMTLDYIWENTNRPLRPLVVGDTFHPPVPTVPPMLMERLRSESLINTRFTGSNERTFILMGHRPRQRIVAGASEDQTAYNLHSYWGVAKNTIMLNSTQHYAYALIQVSGKTTPGAEPLGRIGVGVESFDYIGISSRSDGMATSNVHHILVVVYHGTHAPNRFAHLEFEVMGLDVDDHLQLEARSTFAGKAVQDLMGCQTSGIFSVAAIEPFDKIEFSVSRVGVSGLLGIGQIALKEITDSTFTYLNVDSERLFVHDAVRTDQSNPIITKGLASPEGPYNDFDLPRVRWAKQPSIEIVLPETPNTKYLKLSLSARLQVRDQGRLEVIANGNSLGTMELNGIHNWFEQSFGFPALTGENIIEIRDATAVDQPPPPESLYFLFRSIQIEGRSAP